MNIRKSPCRHKVKSHFREGKFIKSYMRGRGTKRIKKRIVGSIRDELSKTDMYMSPDKIDYRFIEPRIRPLVRLFNEKLGIETFGSGQGRWSGKDWVSAFISYRVKPKGAKTINNKLCDLINNHKIRIREGSYKDTYILTIIPASVTYGIAFKKYLPKNPEHFTKQAVQTITNRLENMQSSERKSENG